MVPNRSDGILLAITVVDFHRNNDFSTHRVISIGGTIPSQFASIIGKGCVSKAVVGKVVCIGLERAGNDECEE